MSRTDVDTPDVEQTRIRYARRIGRTLRGRLGFMFSVIAALIGLGSFEILQVPILKNSPRAEELLFELAILICSVSWIRGFMLDVHDEEETIIDDEQRTIPFWVWLIFLVMGLCYILFSIEGLSTNGSDITLFIALFTFLVFDYASQIVMGRRYVARAAASSERIYQHAGAHIQAAQTGEVTKFLTGAWWHYRFLISISIISLLGAHVFFPKMYDALPGVSEFISRKGFRNLLVLTWVCISEAWIWKHRVYRLAKTELLVSLIEEGVSFTHLEYKTATKQPRAKQPQVKRRSKRR